MKIELQNVLNREIKQRHTTINALAVMCEIPVSVLHSWCNGVLPAGKNLRYIFALSKCLNLPVSVLLFNQDENRPEATIVLNSEFTDGERQYRVQIEKLKGK